MALFKVRDLLINVVSERAGGGSYLCADTSATVPTPITPWVLVAANNPLLEHAKEVTAELAAAQDTTVVEVIDRFGRELGREMVVAALQGGGVYYPDPNCGGSSLETIPTPITPVVHKTASVLQAAHLPGLRKQLQTTLEATERAEHALAPKSAADVKLLRRGLEGALESLAEIGG